MEKNFYTSFNLFYGNENLSKQVKRLSITNCEIDVASELHLPSLFPNVRHLTWRNETVKRSSSIVPHHLLCDDLLKNKWNQLVFFNTYISYGFPFGGDLLSSKTFSKLTTLSIKLSSSVLSANILLLLADVTKNLITLALEHAVVTMNGLEEFHAGVPHLESLNLIDVRLSHSNQISSMTTVARAESISILRISLSQRIQLTPDSVLIASWLTYIGYKYDNVQTLAFKPGNDSFSAPPNSVLEDTLIAMLSRMENLEEFAVRVCRMTNRITDELTGKALPCHIFVWAKRGNFNDQFKSIVDGYDIEKRKYISSLYINVINWNFSHYKFSHILITYFQKLPNLSVLNISNVVIDHGILMYAFMHLPNLVYLYVDKLCNPGKSLPDGTRIQVPKFKLPATTKLKTIIVGLGTYRKQDMPSLNKMFATVLPICKRLKRFGLFGQSNASAPPLELNFLGNKKLKSLDIEIFGLSHYKFQKPGQENRVWSDYNTPCHVGVRYRFFVKLAFHHHLVSSVCLLITSSSQSQTTISRRNYDKFVALEKLKMEDLWLHEVNSEGDHYDS